MRLSLELMINHRLLLIPMALCLSLGDLPFAMAEDSIEQLISPAMIFRSTEIFERQNGPRTDAQDQGPMFGCGFTGGDKRQLGCRAARRAANLAASGHFDEALQQISDALVQVPTESSWLLFRAKLHIKSHQDELARQDLRLAITDQSHDASVQFEIENLLVKLGDYQLATQTIPAILDFNKGGPPIIPAQFQYLLACSQQHLGQTHDAVDNYLAAATNFMLQGQSPPAALCLKCARASATPPDGNVPVDLSALPMPRKNVEALKQMVSRMVTENVLFDPIYVQQLTGARMSPARSGEYFELQPYSHHAGIQLVDLYDIPDQKQSVSVLLEPKECCLLLTDLDDILSHCQRATIPEIWNPTLRTASAFKVPAGTLVISSEVNGFKSITGVALYAPGTPLPGQEPRPKRGPTTDRSDRECDISLLLEAGQTAQALAATDEYCQHYPQDPYAHMWRAQALAAAGRYEKAIQMIDSVVDYANSTHADRLVDRYRGNRPQIQRGMYEVELGKFAQALQDFKQGFPDKPDADDYYYRARAEIGLHQPQSGCVDLEQANNLFFDDARIVRRDQAARLLQDTRRRI